MLFFICTLPGSGKTSLLQLVAKVFNPKISKNVYYINLADFGSGNKTFEEPWNETHPGVDFIKVCSLPKDPRTYSEPMPTFLLIDEGQVAFSKDLSLWGILKGIMAGTKEHVCIILVSTWGSDAMVTGDSTPVEFVPKSTISFWTTNAYNIALQLIEDEATDLWNNW